MRDVIRDMLVMCAGENKGSTLNLIHYEIWHSLLFRFPDALLLFCRKRRVLK